MGSGGTYLSWSGAPGVRRRSPWWLWRRLPPAADWSPQWWSAWSSSLQQAAESQAERIRELSRKSHPTDLCHNLTGLPNQFANFELSKNEIMRVLNKKSERNTRLLFSLPFIFKVWAPRQPFELKIIINFGTWHYGILPYL